jgi:hypothetical protein
VEKNEYYDDLIKIRKFLKSRKIRLKFLSKEMNYSTSHVLTVFNKKNTLSDKFMKAVLIATLNILKRDLRDFSELTKDMSCTTLISELESSNSFYLLS